MIPRKKLTIDINHLNVSPNRLVVAAWSTLKHTLEQWFAQEIFVQKNRRFQIWTTPKDL